MKTFLVPLALLLASTVSPAATPAQPPIRIEHAYSHPTAAPGVPGVGFLDLSNTGRKADRLLAVTSPLAGRIEIHQSKVENGVMQMRAVTGGLPLPAGKTVQLAPGGLHLMLFDLKAPLVEGQSLPLTLRFEHAAPQSLALPVTPREAEPAGEHDGHAH